MAYRIQLSHLATIDLEKIVTHYFELNPETAGRYYNGILAVIKKLKDFPKLGRIVPECEDVFYDKYREVLYENYRIIYRIGESEIPVIRILDGRMDLDFSFVE